MSTFLLAAAPPEAIPPLWRIATKFAYFLALAGAIGGVWTYLTVICPALRRSPEVRESDAALLQRRALRIGAVGTTSLLAVAYFQLAARVARAGDGMAYSEALAPSAVRNYLTKPAKAGEWIATGQLAILANVCIVIAALAMLPVLFGGLPRRVNLLAVIAAATTMGASLVGAVPTKAVTADEILQKVLLQAHIIGGSLWVGGLAALAALAHTRKRLDESAGGAWARIWERFGVLALVSVGGVLVSGTWLTYEAIGSYDQFLTTPFGRFLLVKIALVVGLVAAGAYNQLVLMPKIARARRAGRSANVFAHTLVEFPRVVVTEVVLGVGVLMVVPFLNGSARAQAAGREVDGPMFDGGLLLLGVLLVATLAASFYATARASDMLGRRDVAAG